MDTQASYPALAYTNPAPPQSGGEATDQALAARVTAAISELQVAVSAAQTAGLRINLDFERVRGRLPGLDARTETLVGRLDIHRDLG